MDQINDDIDYQFKFINTKQNEYLLDLYQAGDHILRSHYEILDCYDIASSIWIWSWGNSQIERNLTNESIKIKKNCENLLNGSDYRKLEESLYYGLNACFFISYKNIDKLLSFSKNIIKKDLILRRKIDQDHPKIVEFVILTNIIQQKI